MVDEGQAPLVEPLTAREQEIMRLIADGLTNQQIADQLYLTLDTVKWYNRQLYQKLGVHSRTQAIIRAREIGLLGESSAATKHNLPVQGTRFIGREQEMADIQARLADPTCRLLTLLGPGGIGKTRLAIEVANRQMGAYPHGVYFVPFASVAAASFIVQALADGLGLALTSQRDPLEQITSYLLGKNLLLLLDNFEHLLEAVYLLEEIAAQSKTAKLLVTSRERLRLKEEWVFDVQGLRYPVAERQELERIALTDYEAGQLFLWTAQRAKADFVPDEHDQAHVARICQLVGGMPLGIELAASWVRLLPCAEIARGIAQDLGMLTTVWRNVPERHRSIQAVLDHSWKLLAADEQDTFRRLTIFSNSFQHEAAMAVADASLTMLLALVDKSFLQRAAQDRFSIQELVKQYGSDKLQTDPDTWMATRLRHCQYYAAFLHARMRASNAVQHLDEIENVFDDVQLAWRYAVENRQLDEIQQLATGFLGYYRLHSWYRAGAGALALYQQALECFDPDIATPDQQTTIACLYESLGHLYALASAHEESIDAYHKALDKTADGDSVRRGRLYGKIADVWVVMHQYAPGHNYYTRAQSVLENAHHRDADWWVEWLRIKLQWMELYYWQNRPDDMAELARQIDPLIEQHGAMRQRMRYLYLMSMMALRRDRYLDSSDAISYTGEALALSLQTGNLNDIAARHFYHGFSHLWSDHLDEAETHLQIAREMTEQNGDLTLLARVLTYLAVVYRKRKDVERVREYAAYGHKVAGEANMPPYRGMARAQYAWLAWCAGNLAETKREAGAAIQDWGGLDTAKADFPFRGLALFPLLGVALANEDIVQAAKWAQHLITPPQQRLPDELTASLKQAIAAGENGQRDAASDLLHHALRLARELHYI